MVVNANSPIDERIQKYLARRGFGSRREVEKWLVAGQVCHRDGAYKLGDKVKTGDVVIIGKKTIVVTQVDSPVRVIVYHKREGEVSSRADPQNRPTFMDNLPDIRDGRWKSVGRLDINTTGLILFSNDGELVNLLMHPGSMIERQYLCRIQGHPTAKQLQRLKQGIVCDNEKLRFDRIEHERANKTNHWFNITLTHGKNREIRRAFEALGFRVNRLKRIRYGPIQLPQDLKPGQWLELAEHQINQLRSCLPTQSMQS